MRAEHADVEAAAFAIGRNCPRSCCRLARPPAYHVLVPRQVRLAQRWVTSANELTRDTMWLRQVAWALGVALPLTVVLVVAAAPLASAHEERATGGFRFLVGWGDEPAYTGYRNSVQVTVSEADGGAPVTDLGDALQVEVIKGEEKTALTLQPDFGVGASGTPGDYRAWLTPTRPGTYTLRLIGSIRGQTVDESFTSSPTTFDEVEDVANIQFPAKDPTTGQLATRIDREVPRLDTRTAAVEAALAEAEDRVDGARTLGLMGLAVGVLGLLTAAGALVAARRGSPPGGRPNVGGSRAPAEQAGSPSR